MTPDCGVAACAFVCRCVLGPECVLDEDNLCTLNLRRRSEIDAFIILWGVQSGTLYYSAAYDNYRTIHELEFADHDALREILRGLYRVSYTDDAI